MSTITPEEFAQLQKKFSEIKFSINNVLAVMMALSEMSRRRPDYSEKLASYVLTKAPQIVSSLREFTQALNDEAQNPFADRIENCRPFSFFPESVISRSQKEPDQSGSGEQ
jgi:chromosome condensin MukBEF ATPase and DNA-binding subunit MukB